MLENSLKSVTKGASVIVIGMVIANLLALFNQILMGRILGPENYGLFNLGISIIIILSVLPNFGLGQGLTQIIPHKLKLNKYLEINEAVNFSLKFTLVIGILVAITLFICSDLIASYVFHDSEFGLVLKILSLALPFWTLHNTAGSLAQGFKKPKYYVYVENISMPIIQIFLFVLIYYLGYELFGALIGFTVSTIFAAIAYFYIFKVKFKINAESKISNNEKKSVQKEVLKISYPLFLAGLTFIFMQYADKILLGIFMTPSAVGIYAASLTIATLVLFIYTAFSFNTRPILAEYFAIKDFTNMELLYSSVTKWIFLLTFPVMIYIILYSEDILSLIYGPKFVSGALALSILSIGIAMNSLTGLSGQTLIAIKKTKLNLASELVGAISNIALNLLLIPFFGIIGAAIGTSLSIAFRNFASLFFVYKNLNFNPYNMDYLKIVLYSMPLLGMNFILKKLDITYDFLVVIPIFLVVYFGILIVTDFFDKTDKIIIAKIIAKIKFL